MMEPTRATANQTVFMIGILSTVEVSSGVRDWPRKSPMGLERPRTVVAMARCRSLNQFWLT